MRRRTCRGYTLIELLVVVAIMGVLVSLSALAWRSDPARTLQAEAQRLAGTLELAQARARIGGAQLAFTAAENGYVFWQRDAGAAWREVEAERGLARHTLASGIRVGALALAGSAVALGERIAIAAADDPGIAVRLEAPGAAAIVASGPYAGEMRVELTRAAP